jgi:aminoglycoside phosphotransferase (APT) family kinase protein
VAYEEATGIPLDTVLARSGSAVEAARALGQTAAALATFSASSVAPSRLLGREELLERAESAARMIRFSFPQFGPTVEAALDRLHSDSRPLRSLPIHGDMKLEHAFLDEGRVMFIDTESVALGDPDYDLARLEARLLTARLTWQIGRHLYRAALQELAPRTGENYAWCRIVARLQAAKFFAQRPFASANRTVRALFRDLKLV